MKSSIEIEARVVNGLLWGADELVARAMLDILQDSGPIPEVPFSAIGAVFGGEIVAGVLFSNWRPGCDIEVFVACKNPLAAMPDFFRRALRFPFDHLDLPRVSAEVESTNVKSLAFCDWLGFKQEGVKRQAGRNGADLIVMGLLRDECRFWKPVAKTTSDVRSEQQAAI